MDGTFIAALLGMFIQMFSALFPVINPPGMALIFLSMTGRASRAQRADLARRIGLYAFIVVMVSYYIGAFILSFFGISVPVLRVAGGIVLAASGWRLLNESRASNEAEEPAVRQNASELERLVFYPLTMPITTGPGTISVTIALGATHPMKLPFMLGALAAGAAVAASIYLCYRYADRIEGALGKTGAEALSRLFAFILICVGVQILWTGFSELWMSLAAGQGAPIDQGAPIE
jgi:multiple antibiotic resistance protein